MRNKAINPFPGIPADYRRRKRAMPRKEAPKPNFPRRTLNRSDASAGHWPTISPSTINLQKTYPCGVMEWKKFFARFLNPA